MLPEEQHLRVFPGLYMLIYTHIHMYIHKYEHTHTEASLNNMVRLFQKNNIKMEICLYFTAIKYFKGGCGSVCL